MAATDIHVAGPCLISVATNGSSLASYGYTEDGAQLAIQAGFEDVHADDAGPFMPADIQWMGQVAQITLNMIRYEKSIADIIESFIRSGTGGTITSANIGTLMLAGSKYMQLKVAPVAARSGLSAELPYTFGCCWPVDSINFNMGTRVTRRREIWRAVPLSGSLWTRA